MSGFVPPIEPLVDTCRFFWQMGSVTHFHQVVEAERRSWREIPHLLTRVLQRTSAFRGSFVDFFIIRFTDKNRPQSFPPTNPDGFSFGWLNFKAFWDVFKSLGKN